MKFLHISLLSFLLLVGLICVSISHIAVSRQVNVLQHENRRQRGELGYLVIDDPEKVYVRPLGYSDGLTRKYRVHLPPGKRFGLWQAQSWTNQEFPEGREVQTPLRAPGDPDEFVITVSFRRDEGRWHYQLRYPRGGRGGTIEGDFSWLTHSAEPNDGQQRELNADLPFEIFRGIDQRPGAWDRSESTDGFLLWIKPLDVEETEGGAAATLAGSGLIPPTPPPPRARRQPEPVPEAMGDQQIGAQIEQIGGWVQYDNQGFLTNVTLQYRPVTDTELAVVANLSKLDRLYIMKTQVTDAGLEHVKNLTSLSSLSLGTVAITDEGLVHLRGLANLTDLQLTRIPISDAGLVHLEGLENLTSLNLVSTGVTDAGLESLSRMTLMNRLTLGNTPINGTGLRHLQDMTELAKLFLGNTATDDAGLAHVRRMRNLDTLYLDGTRVTDRGLEQLSGLTNLTTLNLARAQVTDDGMQSLAGLKYLTMLDLSDTEITSAGISHLTGLANLRFLRLNGTAVDDTAIDHLARLELQQLQLSDTLVSDAGAAELAELIPGMHIERVDRTQLAAAREISRFGASSFTADGRDIVRVYFSGARVTNAALRHLEPLTHLRTLVIWNTQLTAAALESIERFPDIRVLELHGPVITDDWLRQLERLNCSPQTLVLGDTQVSDQGLIHIARMPRLEWLEINDSQISDAGLQQLKGRSDLQVYLLRTRVTDRGAAELRETVQTVQISDPN